MLELPHHQAAHRLMLAQQEVGGGLRGGFSGFCLSASRFIKFVGQKKTAFNTLVCGAAQRVLRQACQALAVAAVCVGGRITRF